MCWYSALSLPPLICVAVSIWLRRIYFQKFQAALINCPRLDGRREAELCIPEPLLCIPKQSCWRSAHSLLSLLALVSPRWEQSLLLGNQGEWEYRLFIFYFLFFLKIRTQRCKIIMQTYGGGWLCVRWHDEHFRPEVFSLSLENWYNSSENTGVATDEHKWWVRSLILCYAPEFTASAPGFEGSFA